MLLKGEHVNKDKGSNEKVFVLSFSFLLVSVFAACLSVT